MDPNDQKLIDYIQQELSFGVGEDEIKNSLNEVGWLPTQIENALTKAKSKIIPSPEQTTQSPDTDLGQFNQETGVTSVQEMDTVQLAQEEPTPKRKFSKSVIISLVILLFIGIASAVYGYFYYYLAPERITSESVKKMQTVKTYDYSGSVLMKISGNLFSGSEVPPEFSAMSLFIPREFRLSFTGSVDSADENNTKTETTVNVDINSEEVAEAQIMAIGKLSYFKLNKFSLFPLEGYLNKWLFIDAKELSEQYGLDYEDEQFAELSEEDQNTIYTSFTNNNPVEISERLEGEEIDGNDTFHYQYKVNKDALKTFFAEISPILQEYPQSQDIDVSELNNIMDGLEFHDGEVWIGKKDYYIYRVTGGFKTSIPDSEASIEIAIDISLKNFNQTKNIVAPADYMTFDDLNQMLIEDLSEVFPATGSSEFEENFNIDDYNDFLKAIKSTSPDVSGVNDEQDVPLD